MTSALPSISPSIAVKYRFSIAFGSGLVDSLIWATARCDVAVAINSPAATNRSARMQIPRGVNRLLRILSSKPEWHPPKTRPPGGGLFAFMLRNKGLSVPHAAASRHAAAAGLLLRQLGDHGFGCDQQTGNGGGVLQR